VAITFPLRPVQRFECCCVDCRKGLAVCAAQRGEPPPALPDLVYFPNAFAVASGAGKLRCFTLKQGYPTKRVVASCCHTPLLADHPAYGGLRVVAYRNAPASLRMAPSWGEDGGPAAPRGLRPPDARIYQTDMAAVELALLPGPPVAEVARPDRAALWDIATAEASAALAALHATTVAAGAAGAAASAGGGVGGGDHGGSGGDIADAGRFVTVQELIALIGAIGVSDPDHGGALPRWLMLNPPSAAGSGGGGTSAEQQPTDELGCQRHLFEMDDDEDDDDDWEEGGAHGGVGGGSLQPRRLYFDAAGKSPLLRSAAAAGRKAVGLKSRPWTFGGAKLGDAEAEARALFGTIVGCQASDVAFAPSTAHAMTMAARNLPFAAPR
jgi:hypothetical protein